MNKIKLFGLALVASAVGFSSCEDYLDVKLDDQLSLDEVFSKRPSTESYLKHVYSFLPYEAEYQGTNSTGETEPGGDGAVVPMSDEALFSWYQWVSYMYFRTGDWGPTTPYFNIWRRQYTGIEQAGIFMENVDKCGEITPENRTIMKAEARFIRAYSYFQLVRKYGPCFLWGDRRSDVTIKPAEIDRDPVEKVFEFIIEEIDKAIADLPLELADNTTYAGRLTKGAAMAAKSRILLYAASPLFNGCDLYKGMTNSRGEYLFPQSPDPNKWELAAKAAKEVIDLGLYELYTDDTEDDPFKRAIKSYQGVQFKAWNKEIIWGYWPRYTPSYYNLAAFQSARMSPPDVCKTANGGFCPSLKLVDTYPMAESGRYPVTGYDENGNPIIDEKSGYVADGFTNNWVHPIEERFGPVKAHNSTIGRDARFYASIFANGFYWVNDFIKGGKKIVTFYTGGTSGYKGMSKDCVKVGYLWRRFLNPENNYENGNNGTYFWFYYRLGEIYLNYAEACNEKPNRDEAEALKYINLIRERAGLNKLEEAYPEVKGNKELLRTLLQKERMIELAFEAHRYYDVRRWMIAEKELNGINYTLNLLATNYESSWVRTDQVWPNDKYPNVFEPKHYFFPINQLQLSEMKNITQNYGW